MKCTLRQVVEADRLCWSKLIEDNVKPVPAPGSPLPLDSKLQEALESYEVSFKLMPLPQLPPKRKENWPDRPPKLFKGSGKANTSGKGCGKGKTPTKGFLRIYWGIRSKGGRPRHPTDLASALIFPLASVSRRIVPRANACVQSATALIACLITLRVDYPACCRTPSV